MRSLARNLVKEPISGVLATGRYVATESDGRFSSEFVKSKVNGMIHWGAGERDSWLDSQSLVTIRHLYTDSRRSFPARNLYAFCGFCQVTFSQRGRWKAHARATSDMKVSVSTRPFLVSIPGVASDSEFKAKESFAKPRKERRLPCWPSSLSDADSSVNNPKSNAWCCRHKRRDRKNQNSQESVDKLRKKRRQPCWSPSSTEVEKIRLRKHLIDEISAETELKKTIFAQLLCVTPFQNGEKMVPKLLCCENV